MAFKRDHVKELFRAIERYDIRRLLESASASNLEVISKEEVSEIVGHQSRQRVLEDFKKLILEKDRLKNFVAFLLDYNGHVQKAALAVLYPDSRTQLLANIDAGTVSSEGQPHGVYKQSQESSSTSSSRSLQSPMDVDPKVINDPVHTLSLHITYRVFLARA